MFVTEVTFDSDPGCVETVVTVRSAWVCHDFPLTNFQARGSAADAVAARNNNSVVTKDRVIMWRLRNEFH
jgi:hypothetical protein